MADLQVGDVAPQFELPRQGGGSIKLADLCGTAVVLYFYPQDNTPSCTTEAIGFSQLQSAFESAGARIIGVSPDSVAKHDKFRAKHALAVDLVADEQREVIEAYGLWVEKQLYGRRYMGVERATFLIGRDGKIAAIWRKVRVRGHAEAVLQAVSKL